VWTHHGEIACQRIASMTEEEDDRSSDDRMDEMLHAIRLELGTNHEDPTTPKVQKFFNMLGALEEPLHVQTAVSVPAFVTHLMGIMSKFVFSNKCYKELLSLISDVLPSNHHMPKDMYWSKKLLSALDMEYEKIDVCDDNCMLFYKEHKDETKCLKYGKSRFVEIVNEDDEKVMMKVAHKKLCYMPLMTRMKWLFLSKKTARHMRWHKEGVRENDQVMVHSSDSEAWNGPDAFDVDFARDAWNVCIGLEMDGFMPYDTSAASYSCWPVLAIRYNLPPTLCMKYKDMFLCFIIPSLDHPGTRINVMLKLLIDKLKQLWQGAEVYDYCPKVKIQPSSCVSMVSP
jgi:hypothetical protein